MVDGLDVELLPDLGSLVAVKPRIVLLLVITDESEVEVIIAHLVVARPHSCVVLNELIVLARVVDPDFGQPVRHQTFYLELGV